MPLRVAGTFFVLCALLAEPAPLAGQDVPDRRSPQDVADSVAIAELAGRLVRGQTSDSGRAAAIYEWVARSVAYDVPGYLAGRLGGDTPESAFRRRTAVCGGYVALFSRLARESGLQVASIAGYAKGFDYVERQSTRRVNHAWLAVRIDGSWRLVDPTWGAGVVRDGRFEPRFDWYYFMPAAEELLLSHHPENPEWQLVRHPMSRREFERLPAVPRALLEVGFSPAAVRATAHAGARSFPAVSREAGARVLRAPVSGTLQRASTVEFEVVWPGAADVAVVSGGVWTHLARAGDRFHGRAPAADATVWVVGRTGPDPLSYRTLLHYRVE